MNSETVTLIERPYQEVVDDILTAIVGGVVNEPIIFDVRTDFYPLSEPALDVRTITGTSNGRHHAFLKEIDYEFNPGDYAVTWLADGTKPDDNTTFYVDYFRPEGSSPSPLNDINVGSVTRTLGEAIGREITAVYRQIKVAYRSGFIDTAKGQSLDLVVAILGITRKTKDFARGLATFFRDPAASGNVTIPEGTLLATEKGEVQFETTQPRTLQRGQVRIDVPIRAGDAFKGDKGKVEAGAITQMAQPIEGVARVTNFDPTFLGVEDESDEELRLRAKAVLRSIGKGTLAALARVIFEERAKLVEVWDLNSPPDKSKDLTPGTVTLLVESEPERFPSLQARVQETRAAGVQATLVARYVFFKPRVQVNVGPGLTPTGKAQVVENVIAAIQAYVDGLSSGDPAKGEDLLPKIKEVEDVTDAVIKDVTTWRSDVGRPGAEVLVDALLRAVQTAPPGDEIALRAALIAAVSETPLLVPTGARTLDPSLVLGPDGQTATPEQIEAGEFMVVAEIDDEKWWVYLDMEAADILLKEKES